MQAPGHEREPEAGLCLGRLRRNKVEEFDGDHAVEQRHGDFSHLTSVLWGVCKGFQLRLPPREVNEVGLQPVVRPLAATCPARAVVRNVCLFPPNSFGFLVAKPCKTAKFFNPLNVFPMSPVFVTTPFLVQKALKTENSEKCVFCVRRQKCSLGLQIRSFSAENLLQCLQCSEIRFLPRKTCEFQPAELVTAEVTGL